MATNVVTGYNGTPALGGSIFVQIRDPSNGSVLVARTNGGIHEYVSGCYIWSGSLTSLESYEVSWDENNGVFALDVVYPSPTIVVTDTGGTPLPVVGDANGTIAGLTFLIKRNDTLPYLRRQLVDTNNNAVVLDVLDTVKFTMRASTDVTMSGSPKVHADAVIIDASQGIVEYRWATGDTDTTTYSETSTLGRPTDTPYAGEFEVTRVSDSRVETFPQGGYIAVSIPPDLDPGITP